MQLFMITGGPSVGKTTLIDFFKSKGFAIVPDSARTIIKDQVCINDGGLPWKNKHLDAQLMFNEPLKAYHQILDRDSNRIIFLIVDCRILYVT